MSPNDDISARWAELNAELRKARLEIGKLSVQLFRALEIVHAVRQLLAHGDRPEFSALRSALAEYDSSK